MRRVHKKISAVEKGNALTKKLHLHLFLIKNKSNNQLCNCHGF